MFMYMHDFVIQMSKKHIFKLFKLFIKFIFIFFSFFIDKYKLFFSNIYIILIIFFFQEQANVNIH